ncbi:hypothetical protein [Sphingopyxis terrae]|uniref:hypothetical protein n=1 Tax=Sphingopyxis terrae TaxID=33052 RepID=UPI001C2C6ACE|nr:hypothetical protein [Sphingopyxis terrae]QXF14318.1 hypothetical protein HBA51_18795 [Sphingopyxis terrae subsp. terrae]
MTSLIIGRRRSFADSQILIHRDGERMDSLFQEQSQQQQCFALLPPPPDPADFAKMENRGSWPA